MIGDPVAIEIRQRIVAHSVAVEIQADRVEAAIAVKVQGGRAMPDGRGSFVPRQVAG